jgi:hypothetical protein
MLQEASSLRAYLKILRRIWRCRYSWTNWERTFQYQGAVKIKWGCGADQDTGKNQFLFLFRCNVRCESRPVSNMVGAWIWQLCLGYLEMTHAWTALWSVRLLNSYNKIGNAQVKGGNGRWDFKVEIEGWRCGSSRRASPEFKPQSHPPGPLKKSQNYETYSFCISG